MADLTVSGNDIFFGSAGAKISADTNVFTVTAGDSDTDDLFLVAGNSFHDGRLAILGDGLFQLRAGNGLFTFVDGSTNLETASPDGSGNTIWQMRCIRRNIVPPDRRAEESVCGDAARSGLPDAYLASVPDGEQHSRSLVSSLRAPSTMEPRVVGKRVLWPLEEEIAGSFAQARVRPTGKPRLLLTRATLQREKR